MNDSRPWTAAAWKLRSGTTLLLLASLLAAAAPAQPSPRPVALPITLPIEVVGEDGTTVTTPVFVPTQAAAQARTLYLQIHGLEYADLASVRVNRGPWISLNNRSAQIAEPGKSYGGIGGGFATLKMTLALPAGSLADGGNTIDFRFNRTDGVVSGFRVLAFNFLSADGRPLLPANAFQQEDPDSWTPPLPDAESVAAGKALWNAAPLVANGLKGAPPIRAHCADCHARDGRDLKYFNFSNASIAARSRFHGLSPRQGEQIASYIRTLRLPNPGRPWNPPYQPGPGQSTVPAARRSAGAGLDSALMRDLDTVRYLLPGPSESSSATPAAFAPDANLDPREIPIALQLPDWNHWLPRVHPLDAWGDRFQASDFARLYQASAGSAPKSWADPGSYFDKWIKARGDLTAPHLAEDSKRWTPELSETLYSAQCWQLVKTWEITQESALEGRSQQLQGPGAPVDPWPNTVPAATAPATAGIPDGPNGMGGSALTNEYYDNAWYALQMVVHSGDHQHRDRLPLDWLYLAGRIRTLQRLSGQPEPGRLLITVAKSMQSTDPRIGPENQREGWRPDRMLDPRILVDEGWSSTFAALPTQERLAVTNSLLTGWLDKSMQYPVASYFRRAQIEGTYTPPKALGEVFGGRPWRAAPQFRALGVDPALVQRLEAWGKEYDSMVSLFHY